MRRVALCLIVLALVASASYAFTGKCREGIDKRLVLPAMRIIKVLMVKQEKLNLSDDQVAQLRELSSSLREQVHKYVKEMAQIMRQARKHYRVSEDKEAIKNRLHNEMQEIKEHLRKLNEKAMMHIKQILTDEQIQKVHRYLKNLKGHGREPHKRGVRNASGA